jgi:hypothetical protein
MGALKSLDISNQSTAVVVEGNSEIIDEGSDGLGAEGAKYLAEALKDHP